MQLWMGIKHSVAGDEEHFENVSGYTMYPLDIQLDHILHEYYVDPKAVWMSNMQQSIHQCQQLLHANLKYYMR